MNTFPQKVIKCFDFQGQADRKKVLTFILFIELFYFCPKLPLVYRGGPMVCSKDIISKVPGCPLFVIQSLTKII